MMLVYLNGQQGVNDKTFIQCVQYYDYMQVEEYTNMISIYSQLIKAMIKAWVVGKAYHAQ